MALRIADSSMFAFEDFGRLLSGKKAKPVRPDGVTLLSHVGPWMRTSVKWPVWRTPRLFESERMDCTVRDAFALWAELKMLMQRSKRASDSTSMF